MLKDAAEPTAKAMQAEALAWLGRSAQAREQAQAVSAEPSARSRAARVLGRLALPDDVDGALLRFDEAIALARAPGDAAVARLDAAEALLDRNGPADTSAAVSHLAEAREEIGGAGLESK